eukprot:661063-Hanusia_phi.AAC.2
MGQEEEVALRAAEEEYRRTVRLDPEYVLAYNNLALALMRRRELAQAGSLLYHALSLAPSHPLLLSNSRLLSSLLQRKEQEGGKVDEQVKSEEEENRGRNSMEASR